MNHIEEYTDHLILKLKSKFDYNIPLLISELNMLCQEIYLGKEQNENKNNAVIIPYVNTMISELKEYQSMQYCSIECFRIGNFNL